MNDFAFCTCCKLIIHRVVPPHPKHQRRPQHRGYQQAPTPLQRADSMTAANQYTRALQPILQPATAIVANKWACSSFQEVSGKQCNVASCAGLGQNFNSQHGPAASSDVSGAKNIGPRKMFSGPFISIQPKSLMPSVSHGFWQATPPSPRRRKGKPNQGVLC